MSDVRDPDRDQVLPTPNDGPSMHDLVIADILERKEHGLTKYGSLLQTHNGRNFLQDIYEELLDATAYIKGRLEEDRLADKEPDYKNLFQEFYKLVADTEPPEESQLGYILEAYSEAYAESFQHDSPSSVTVPSPTEPGFYRYSGGNQLMIFLLDHSNQWYTIFDNGVFGQCEWGYIEQCLGVYDLIKIVSDGD